MALKLTVMGRLREAPTEYAQVGSLLLHPIAPPVRVGDAWVMPPVDVRQSTNAADRDSIEAMAHSLGLGKYTPYAPPPASSLKLGAGHMAWPFEPKGTRHEIFNLADENGSLLLIYFRVKEPRMVFGIEGTEMEVDCGWAIGCTGAVTATWDRNTGRTSLTYFAATPTGVHVEVSSGAPMDVMRKRAALTGGDLN